MDSGSPVPPLARFRRLLSHWAGSLLVGLAGGLTAWLASNLWLSVFGARLIPGWPAGSLIPDPLFHLLMNAYVGLGCGYAGRRTAEYWNDPGRASAARARILTLLYTFFLGAGVALLVNAALLFMSYF